jgi:O-methyltransferase involved in polyketide biosynthesis
MRHSEPSRTMVNTAVLRAAHQVLDDDPKILVDPIAVGLVPEASIDALRADACHLRGPELTLRRASMVLRSRFAEDRLATAFMRGMRQYVVVAAGLDTFAWRQPTFAQAMRIFAVEMPALRNPVHCGHRLRSKADTRMVIADSR